MKTYYDISLPFSTYKVYDNLPVDNSGVVPVLEITEDGFTSWSFYDPIMFKNSKEYSTHRPWKLRK